MEPQKVLDIRWQTRNTKLASALLCKGFTLCAQPFLTDVKDGKKTTTIFFPNAVRIEGEVVTAEQIEEEWEESKHTAPVTRPEIKWMRDALYARDELITTYIHPTLPFVPTSGHLIKGNWLKTDDLILAASIRSTGYAVRGFRDRCFYFDEEAKGEALYFDSKADPEHPMQWRRVVQLQQYQLIGAIREHNCANIRRIPGPGKSSAILPVNMPEDLARKMLRELYRNQ